MTKYLLTALVFCAGPCLADVRLPKLLDTSMVLQRESQVKIWGWAYPGEEVRFTCDWLDTKASVQADADGKWQVSINTGGSGGPHAMTIAGKTSHEGNNASRNAGATLPKTACFEARAPRPANALSPSV